MDHVDKLPAPLLDALLQNRVLPVVGAGFSRNAQLPAGRSMPTWDGLGDLLEGEVTYATADTDALEVISAYAAEHGRQALVARLRRALSDGVAKPGDAHRAFARLPFETVVTTNFDVLLEDAYRDVGRPMRVLNREDQLASLVPANAVSLVKAHGDLDNEPVLVATEQDYDEFLLRRPLLATYLGNQLITRVALLVGYSLTDPDWRQLLAAVRTRLGRSQQIVYALEVNAPPVLVERFRRRGVTVINLESDTGDYAAPLIRAFDEMRQHVADHTLDESVVREEGALEELRAVDWAERRLCLFLLPERLLAYYREQVFPVLRESGFQAVTSYDVDGGTSSLYSTALALMQQAAAIVADVSDGEGGVRFELGLAMSSPAARQNRLAVASGNDSGGVPVWPSELGVRTYIFRGLHLDADYPNRIVTWLQATLGPPVRSAPSDANPHGYEWRLVAAFRDLELALEPYSTRRQTLAQSLRALGNQGVIQAGVVERLLDGYRIRNEVLHRGLVPEPLVVDEIVDSVRDAVRVLEINPPRRDSDG